MPRTRPSPLGKRILFAYRAPIRPVFEAIERGELPASYAVGYQRFQRQAFELSYYDHDSRGRTSQVVARAINPAMARLLGVGFDISPALQSLPAMRRQHVIFTTLDGAGLPVMLLRLLGLLRTPVVHRAGGLLKRFRAARGSLRWRVTRRLLSQATCIVCYSQTQQEWLTQFMDLPPNRVLCLNSLPAVDVEFLNRAPVGDEGFVLSAGRERHRDFGLLFEVAQQLPDIDFVAVGGRKSFAGLRAPANVKTFIELPYPRLVELYRAARLVVLPVRNNRYSNAGLVLGEVMSLGKAVVLSNVEAVRGIAPLESGECCVLVDPGDVGQLSEAVGRLNEDGARREALGQRAKAVARDCFSLDRYVAQMSDLFARVASKRA
ncbi:MAG: glycosyltransferase [Chloroflexi bacterium]|nr:glycosyltransferase [Chloroflexota bacterium]